MARIQFANQGASYLAAPVVPSDTVITVVSDATFPPIDTNKGESFFLVLEAEDLSHYEVCRCTAWAPGSNTFTVTRGVGGTQPASFAANDFCQNRLNKSALEDFIQRTGDTMPGDFLIQGTFDAEDIATFASDVVHTGTITRFFMRDADGFPRAEIYSDSNATYIRAVDIRDMRLTSNGGAGRVFIEDLSYPRSGDITEEKPLIVRNGAIISSDAAPDVGDVPDFDPAGTYVDRAMVQRESARTAPIGGREYRLLYQNRMGVTVNPGVWDASQWTQIGAFLEADAEFNIQPHDPALEYRIGEKVILDVAASNDPDILPGHVVCIALTDMNVGAINWETVEGYPGATGPFMWRALAPILNVFDPHVPDDPEPPIPDFDGSILWPIDALVQRESERTSPLTGRSYRLIYQNRTGAAIPAGVWDAADWTQIGAFNEADAEYNVQDYNPASEYRTGEKVIVDVTDNNPAIQPGHVVCIALTDLNTGAWDWNAVEGQPDATGPFLWRALAPILAVSDPGGPGGPADSVGFASLLKYGAVTWY